MLTQRLALDGDAPLTLQSIGERMGITRERVRQLQNRALDRMCRRRAPPGVRQYATEDGYCILIEVKPLLDMPLAINQAKAAAARAFCARNGWGFLVTDLRRSLNDLLAMPVPEEASRQFADALRETGTMTWQDIKVHRTRCGLNAVQVAALATQRGWYIRLSPYRMTRRPPPG